MASNVYRLTVRRGPEEGQSFSVSEDSITIGRDPSADIVLADPEVSRQHARLTRRDEGYQIQDLGSTNGTFIDGKRLGGEPAQLSPGSIVTMGSNVTMVYDATADPLATVISAEPAFEFPESDEEAGFEEESSVADSFEMPESEPEIEVNEAQVTPYPADDATSVEFPPAEQPASLPAAEEEEEAALPSFEDSGYEPADDQRTVLDMEAQPSFSYGYEEEDEGGELPSFGEDLPSFDAEPEPDPSYTPQPEAIDRTPPPPPPPSPPEQEKGRNRNMIIAIVIALLLLCCCCLLAYVGWIYGDALLFELGVQ